jgi:nicotinamidase-related amidase
VVDAQRHFLAPDGRAYLPVAPAVIPRIAALLAGFRALGAPVLFSRHGHPDGEPGIFGRFYRDYLRRGEADWALLPDLAPLAGETILEKSSYDAFLGTDLEARLRAAGASQLLLCGVQTHLCCDTTARAAFCRGFEVHLPVDALASKTEQLHLGALRGLADGVAVLHSVAEVLSRCSARR